MDTMKHTIICLCLLVLTAFISCEKVNLDDLTNQKEQKSGNKKEHPSKENEQGDKHDQSWKDKPGQEKHEKPYEEKDIKDGNKDKEGDKPSTGDNGTVKYFYTGDTVTVTDFLSYSISVQVWVKGYIVGSCASKLANADFSAPFEGASALLLAASPQETEATRCVTIQLKSGSSLRKRFNLVNHPELKGRQAAFFGIRETYLGQPGIKGATSYWGPG
ncbi:DUF6359 domain-containing protein [Segatella buccae]|uniref:DUF6359 domain-containing protein n=1 Tax=Segatella buccae TaxID=28126 RepID=UPI0025911B24|nr:DUF6359 domain-containing protein [Segatella buccae]